MVDKIGYLDDVIADLATHAGLSNPNAVRVEREPGLLEAMMGGSAQSNAGAKVSIGSVNLSIDQSTINSLTRGRLMYLAPGF